jgi:uncharacterized FAD-dependent dehydrogenase
MPQPRVTTSTRCLKLDELGSGEGAGCAGGIVNAAAQALRTARAIIARHASAL